MRAKSEGDPSHKLAEDTKIALMRLAGDALNRGDRQAFREIQETLYAATFDVDPLPAAELMDIFELANDEGKLEVPKVLNALLNFAEMPKYQALNPDQRIRARASLYRLEAAISDFQSGKK